LIPIPILFIKVPCSDGPDFFGYSLPDLVLRLFPKDPDLQNVGYATASFANTETVLYIHVGTHPIAITVSAHDKSHPYKIGTTLIVMSLFIFYGLIPSILEQS
jgi:hypothetical protein